MEKYRPPTTIAASSGLYADRRGFLLGAGTVVGGALFGGLEAFGRTGNAGADETGATDPGDPIWGVAGAATRIVEALRSVSQAAFPARDFLVTDFGALPCTVVDSPNPYTSATLSPASAGSGTTHAPSSFDARPAFLAAIRACNAAGGGRVVVPPGTWYCAGPIVLLSHVNFHLSANCQIYFSPRPADYAKDGPVDCGANGRLYYSRFQSNDCLNFGSPVYAHNQTQVAITGTDRTSILNGQGMTPFAGTGNTSTCWWTYKGSKGQYGFVDAATTPSAASNNPLNIDLRTKVPGISDTLYQQLTDPVTPWQQDQNYLPCLSEAGVSIEQRIFGLGHYLRPNMVTFIGCTDVLMENYQTRNTPCWQHHPVACRNVVIRGVLVDSTGLNNDGFDPDACDMVLCENVEFNTGDDCIAIKSGKNLDVQYGPAQNHVIQNCIMQSGHGGLTLGSEMSAGIQKVYARNLEMRNIYWATNALNIAIRIKTNMNRGGYVRDLYVDNVILAHGVSLSGHGYGSSMLAGSPINGTVPAGVATATAANPAASEGGIITFDCDYQPSKDAIRSRPPSVQNIQISRVRAGNVTVGGATASCFQAIVAQGPVKQDYNGPQPVPAVPAITGVTISDCDFGTPVAVGPASATKPGPVYAFNVHDIVLKNVKIAGTVYNTTISDAR
ncbi:glycoside hydrolase family 28 protein [Xylophilus ampelinus]|uniref:Polygalacturonase n=1 Tax=Xylophilus ampelinus TaxID=54067 RepID=A0A318SEX8_9BURK|nr:glycoside hydrolase family 28 protein [Xylophilus ampelinus]MCS4511168.1 glycoside hydrolase family 28 protein [Xylophilus ampelinus]PYE75079.1 polygalacturonase [Xylophilus ampelinus]